jgi:hypothetical protein
VTWEEVATDATSDGAVVATRAGIFRVDNRSDRATSLNKGLIRGNAGMLGAIGETVFTNTSNGIYRSTDHGEHWMQVSDFSGWGFTRDGNVLYTSSGIAYRSSDSGATWTPTGPLFGFDWDGPPQRNDVTSIAAADGAVYIGVARYLTDKGANGGWASGGIYRSTDDGATWQEMNNGLPHGAGGVPAPINGIIATRDHILIATAAGIYRSTDRGARWVPSMTGLPAGDRYMGAGELTAGVSTTYLRLGTGHFESTDGGLSWQPLSTPLPDGFGWSSGYSVVDDRIYMRSYRSNGANGFDERLFMLKDRSWEDISATQPENVRVESIIRAGRYLYAGTRSDGVWTQQTGGALPSSVAFGSAAHRSGALEIFPNPSADQTEIRCTLSAPGRLRITLTSMLGEEVAAFDGGTSDAGTRSIRIDTRGIAAGVYLIHVRAGNETHEGRVVIGR